jgi:C4-dicarboxylate-specific signal transduction histidine kinase
MQTIGNHDGFRLPQIPRIAVAIGLGAAAGWASDSVRRHRALLADNHAKATALRELTTDLERQVAERTTDLTAANASLATQLEHRKRVEASAAAAGRMAVVGTLAAGIGHEINNPLAAIIANLDVALEQLVDAPPTIREALQDARLAADRVAEIVRNLRGLIESKSDRPTADVPRVVKSTLQMVSNQLQGRARIDLDLADTASAAISESRLGQILLNLLTNAAHAMPAGGSHELRIEARPCANRMHAPTSSSRSSPPSRSAPAPDSGCGCVTSS